MNYKNILLGSVFLIGGGALYFLFFKKKQTNSIKKPELKFIAKENDVVIESQLTKDVIDPVLASTVKGKDFIDVINSIAPKVITEEDKRKEQLAQYFRDQMVEIEKRECCDNYKINSRKKNSNSYGVPNDCNKPYRLEGNKYKIETSIRKLAEISKCEEKKKNDLINKEAELSVIGYSYRGNGKILKIR